MTTKAATHTPGALRAAEIIATEFKDSPQLRLRVLNAAAIIDRETAAPEMLEALTRGHLHFLQCNNLSADDREMLDEMWAAIQKARGGQ